MVADKQGDSQFVNNVYAGQAAFLIVKVYIESRAHNHVVKPNRVGIEILKCVSVRPFVGP